MTAKAPRLSQATLTPHLLTKLLTLPLLASPLSHLPHLPLLLMALSLLPHLTTLMPFLRKPHRLRIRTEHRRAIRATRARDSRRGYLRPVCRADIWSSDLVPD